MLSLLIADDEPNVVKCMKEDIDWGSIGVREVFSVISIREVWDILNKVCIDIIIIDIRMPYLKNGMIINLIKKRFPQIKIVLLSDEHEAESYQKLKK